jgi:hypothetical protein
VAVVVPETISKAVLVAEIVALTCTVLEAVPVA